MSAEQQQELLDEAERRVEELKALQDRAVAIVGVILGATMPATTDNLSKVTKRITKVLREAEDQL